MRFVFVNRHQIFLRRDYSSNLSWKTRSNTVSQSQLIFPLFRFIIWILGHWRPQTHQNHWSKNERSNRRKEIKILSHSKYLHGYTERKRKLCTGHSPPLGRPGGNIRIRHNPTWFKWKKTLIPNGRRCLISMLMIIIFSNF